MTWDVPTEFDCPSCGQTMFKKSGRGQMKPFCINEKCENFLPEDKRGYRPRAAASDGSKDGENAKKTAKSAKSAKTAAKRAAKPS